jgi:hypothetical protein
MLFSVRCSTLIIKQTYFLSATSRASRKRIFSPQKNNHLLLGKNKDESASLRIKVYEDIDADESDTLIPCRSRRHRLACLPPRQFEVQPSVATSLESKSSVRDSNPKTKNGDVIYWESQEYDEIEILPEDCLRITFIDTETAAAAASVGILGSYHKSKDDSNDQNSRHLKEHSKDKENIPSNQQSKATVSTKGNGVKGCSDGAVHITSNNGTMSRGQRQNIRMQNSFLNLSILRPNSASVSASVSTSVNKLTFVPVPVSQTSISASTFPVSRQIVKHTSVEKPLDYWSDSGCRSNVFSPLTVDSRTSPLSLPSAADICRSDAVSATRRHVEHSIESSESNSEKNRKNVILDQFLSVEKEEKEKEGRVRVRKHPINAPHATLSASLSLLSIDVDKRAEEKKGLTEEQSSSSTEVEVEVEKYISVRHITVFAASHLEKLKHDTWELHLALLLKRSRERADRVKAGDEDSSSSSRSRSMRELRVHQSDCGNQKSGICITATKRLNKELKSRSKRALTIPSDITINMLLETLTLVAVDKRRDGQRIGQAQGEGKEKGEGRGEEEGEILPVCLSNRPRGTHGVFSEAVSGMRYCVHEVVGKGAFGYAVLATATSTAPTLTILAGGVSRERGCVGTVRESRTGAGAGVGVGRTVAGARRGSKQRGDESECPPAVQRAQGSGM